MNITYISAIDIPSKWAHSIQVMKMAQAFQQTGHEVELISACSFKDWSKDVSASVWEHYGISTPFKLTRLPLSRLVQIEKKRNCGRFSFGYFSALLAKRKKTDIVYTRNYLAPYWSARLGIPTVAETHSDPDDYYQKQRLYEATRMDSFKALVTISEILAEGYVKAGVPEEKVVVEQDGVDLSVFSSADEKEIQKVRAHLLNGKRTVALYAGHLYDYKGIPLILEAAGKLPDVSFVLVGGWDDDVERVRRSAEELGLKNLSLTGFVHNNKVPVYLRAADVLLLPYSGKHHQASTTSPLTLFEYMASSRPIVATNIGNIVNVLRDGRNAILCNPDDAGGFKDAIKKVLSDRGEAGLWAKEAQRDVQIYDWKHRARRILEFSGL
jgi:glycosyltransferase involved in cell wall biosynthesis